MKHHYLWPILLLISCSPAKKEKCEPIYSQMMVETHGLGDFYCNRHHQAKLDTTGWDYVSGLVAHSVLKAWSAYPEKKAYYDAVKAFADNSSGIVTPLRLVHSGILTYFAPMKRNQENICPMAKIKQTGKPAQAAAGQP